MKRVESVLDLIGNTPLVRLNNLVDPDGAQVWVKLEYINPGSSVKDRIAIRIVDDYEKAGVLKPGGTIVEATSGNTGMGLALVAAVRGYKTIFVMPDKISEEKRRALRALGSEVIIAPTAVKSDDPTSYYSVAKRIVEETPGAVLANQYFNPSNVEAHYDTTGPEIWEQTEGKVDVFVSGLGTGGTVSGIGRYLKEKNPDLKIIGADPYGSILKVFKETGEMTSGYPYLVEGIGEDIIPGNLHLDLVDEIINVHDADAFHISRQLAKKEGIFAGSSTGTIIKVALEVAARMRPDQVVVSIIPDTGDRYLSKHYSDEWLAEKGMLDRDKMSIRRLRKLKKQDMPSIIHAVPTDTVRAALDQMRNHNFSQMPVLDGNNNLGSIRESSLLSSALKDNSFLDRKINDIMEKPFPSVDESTNVEQCIPMLLQYQGLVLTNNNLAVGFITRHDVIDIKVI